MAEFERCPECGWKKIVGDACWYCDTSGKVKKPAKKKPRKAKSE